jgi:hypothetical protein
MEEETTTTLMGAACTACMARQAPMKSFGLVISINKALSQDEQ